MNLSYSTTLREYIPGMVVDMGPVDERSFSAVYDVEFGSAAVSKPGVNTIGPVKIDNLTLTFSADLVTGNVVNGLVSGLAIPATTFTTDHNTTMALIATRIAALTGVTSAVVSAARVITVTTDYVTIFASGWVVTGGASQATITAAALTTDKVFRGVVRHEHNVAAKILAKAKAAVVTKGRIAVPVTKAVAIDATAYVNVAQGGFTDSATNNISTGSKFITATTGVGIAVIELNLPT